VKDAMDALSPLPIQNKISSWSAETSYHWRDALGNGTKDLFSDPEALLSVIDEGNMLNTGFGDKPLSDVLKQKRGLFAAAMRTVWMTGEDSKPASSPLIEHKTITYASDSQTNPKRQSRTL